MRFIFFTKTNWVEPPRLRHQLAHLLADAGHEVIFFEQPTYPFTRSICGDSGHPRICLYRYREGLHHKLRLHPSLHYVNAVFVKAQISRVADNLKLNDRDVIVNFNYEYFFLKELFPKQRLITIINDDFWSTAIAGYEKPLRWALGKTCQVSDVVLTVSPLLKEQLKAYCNAELFYPWADLLYQAPLDVEGRTALLYWGYIGDRIDYEYLAKLSLLIARKRLSIRIIFIGPITKGNQYMHRLIQNHVVEYFPEGKLETINLNQVCGALIPYRSSVKSIDAITIPNKAFQLLSRGLPLLITGMPHFFVSKVVYRLNQGDDADYETIKYVRDNFQAIQDSIREILSVHSADHRLEQFMQKVVG